jgi:hypothetical protein
MLRKRGRRRDDVQVSVCPYMQQMTPEMVGQYAKAGVDRLILVAAAADEQRLVAALDALAPLAR